MKLQDIVHLLEGEVIHGSDKMNLIIEECFAADLMSDVLAFSSSHGLLITGLSSVQSIHTADLADFKAIVFVNHKKPQPQALELAVKKNMPVITTRMTLFDACGVLYQAGLTGGQKP